MGVGLKINDDGEVLVVEAWDVRLRAKEEAQVAVDEGSRWDGLAKARGGLCVCAPVVNIENGNQINDMELAGWELLVVAGQGQLL
ncbi:hypothetical protein V6N13_130018 [Hibiscus sabdariffa]|uniref:Uncharacterized protein n=1 Tax=Hibiscus sabdariffa TaxID=183260 RepID=A0ABR2SMY7_9ROSI